MNTLSTNQKKATDASIMGTAALGLLAAAGMRIVAPSIAPADFDWSAWIVQLFPLLLAPLTILVVYFVRVAMDTYIPPMVLPILGPIVAVVAEWLQSLASSGTFNPIVAGVLGLVAALAYAAARLLVGDES